MPCYTEPPLVVLDTNVVLDCLLFHNTQCAPLQQALASGALRWVATASMRDELADVLAHGRLDRWNLDPSLLWSAWDEQCVEVAAPAPTSPAIRLRCSDPDDQKFIDLAVACSARWLLSRDRAVLKLRRRLQAFGVEVSTPDDWAKCAGRP